MCEPANDFTTQPDSGPFDDSVGYRVTEEGLKALEEYEKRHGTTVVQKAPRPGLVARARPTEDRQEHRRQRRKQAREQGHRIVTVCGKWRGNRKIPDIRLMGLWLEQAGFDLGRLCEIEISPGTLTIRAV